MAWTDAARRQVMHQNVRFLPDGGLDFATFMPSMGGTVQNERTVMGSAGSIALNYAAPSRSRRWALLVSTAVGLGMAILLYLAPRVAAARGQDDTLLFTLASSPWMETGNDDVMFLGLFPFWIIIGACAGTTRFRISRIAFPSLFASHVLYMVGVWYLVSDFGTQWFFFRDILEPIVAAILSLYLAGLALLWLIFLKTNRAADKSISPESEDNRTFRRRHEPT